jgi:hypothetical protein
MISFAALIMGTNFPPCEMNSIGTTIPLLEIYSQASTASFLDLGVEIQGSAGVVGRDNYLKGAYPPCDLGSNQAYNLSPRIPFNTGVVDGGSEESVKGRCSNNNIDILRFAGATDREEGGTANKNKIISVILGEEDHGGVENFK